MSPTIQNPYWDAVQDWVIDARRAGRHFVSHPSQRIIACVVTAGYLTVQSEKTPQRRAEERELEARVYGRHAAPEDDAFGHVEQRALQLFKDKQFDQFPNRVTLVNRYGFSVTDPDSVDFVAKHAGTAVLDPMAGSGYLCYLLDQHGIDTLAYDQMPWDQRWVHVLRGHAPFTVARHGRNRTLILSWPDRVPEYDRQPTLDDALGRSDQPPPRELQEHERYDIGAITLAAYRGDTVIFIGNRAWCGGPALHEQLDSQWERIDAHIPVHWVEGPDYIEVFRRRKLTHGPYVFSNGVVTTDPDYATRRISEPFLGHTAPCILQVGEALNEEFANSGRPQTVVAAGLYLLDTLEQRPELCTCGRAT